MSQDDQTAPVWFALFKKDPECWFTEATPEPNMQTLKSKVWIMQQHKYFLVIYWFFVPLSDN